MIKITGLEQLSRQLTGAQKAAEALDGELGTVSFDPNDPASIEAAIKSVETIIDERLASYIDNAIVDTLAANMKEKYRESIVDRAASARLEGDKEQ